MAKICAFFGHRSIPEDLEPRLRALIIRAITQYGITEFWNGGYGDFDRLAERVVHSLKPEFPNIRNRLIYAYPPQYPHRPSFDDAFFPDFLNGYADNRHIPQRNVWMAKQCDIMIAYVEHDQSRIYEPLKYMSGKKPILNLGDYQPPDKA